MTKDPSTSLPARSRDACPPYKTLEGVTSAKAGLGMTLSGVSADGMPWAGFGSFGFRICL